MIKGEVSTYARPWDLVLEADESVPETDLLGETLE